MEATRWLLSIHSMLGGSTSPIPYFHLLKNAFYFSLFKGNLTLLDTFVFSFLREPKQMEA